MKPATRVASSNHARALSGKCRAAPISVDVNSECQSIIVNAPVAEVYRRCLRFEALPQFITSITKIERINDTSFFCTSDINGEDVSSLVQVTMRVSDRRIAWQAASEYFRVGVAFFDPLAGGTTKVTVKLRSILEPVTLTGALRDHLKHFKRMLEEDVPTK